MKKILLLIFIFEGFSLFAELPSRIFGLWEGKDRYVFFEQTENEEGVSTDQIVICLKEYYGWYVDRTAEDKSYSQKEPRTINAGTTKEPVYIKPDSKNFREEDDSFSLELVLTYAKHDINYIPLCVIDDTAYLEFFQRSGVNPNFFMGSVVSEGITVAGQKEKPKFVSWILDEENSRYYKIPFWKIKMDYDSSLTAHIKDGEYECDLNKHIFSAENVYACVPGRRVNVRNLLKFDAPFEGKNVVYNENKTLCAIDEPYLKRLLDKDSFDDLVLIVSQSNSRRKPDPPPLFPEKELDFHWDLIDLLEKDNEFIKGVRQRQREFGPRGKEIGK